MDGGTPNQSTATDLSGDLLKGAHAISKFIFGGDDAKSNRRKVYHLATSSRLPTFRLGSQLCARKSVLLEWIKKQEGRVLDPAE